MSWLGSLTPTSAEREHCGRFLLAGFVAEVLNVVAPFQFLYLLLVLPRPEHAALVLLCGAVATVVFEVPTGVIADRFGRKRSVLIGDTLSGIVRCLVPLVAVTAPPSALLPLFGALFVADAFAETLVSGAEDAWVCDNLDARGQGALTESYFARERSLASVAGLVAGLIALALVLASVGDPRAPLLHALWIAAGVAEIVAVLVLAGAPELVPGEEVVDDDDEREDDDPDHDTDHDEDEDEDEDENKAEAANDEGLLATAAAALRVASRVRPLRLLLVYVLLGMLCLEALDEAFEVALFARGVPLWLFAALWLAGDAIGVVAPLLARRAREAVGTRTVLALVTVVPALGTLLILTSPPAAIVLCLALTFRIGQALSGPLLDTRVMQLTPSAVRASVGSLFAQVEHIAGIGSIALLGLVLGASGGQLAEQLPDLAEAFSGEPMSAVSASALAIADRGVWVLGLVGLFAVVPLLMRDGGGGSGGGESEASLAARALETARSADDSSAASQGDASQGDSSQGDPNQRGAEARGLEIGVDRNCADAASLHAAAAAVQREISLLNPGEELSWWVAAQPFRLPRHTLDTLRDVGPALDRFFPAARRIADADAQVRRLLEKRIHPVYRRLNDAQPGARPILIRPDVVPDADWNPRFVELEITVAGRADVGAMCRAYGVDRRHDTAAAVARWMRAQGLGSATLALLTAPHPFFLDLPDDARGWAVLLREQGLDVIVLADDDLEGLRFDGTQLLYHPARAGTGQDAGAGRGGPAASAPRRIDVIDRFVDIYEIAELQHPGMAAVQDAYIAGAVRDLNTCAQFLDEKLWMALLFEPRLQRAWARELGAQGLGTLHAAVLPTRMLHRDTVVPIEGRDIAITRLHEVPAALRTFAVKESGTSTTASGAQGFHVLSQMSDSAVRDLVGRVLTRGPDHVVQDLVESARITFDALDIDVVQGDAAAEGEAIEGGGADRHAGVDDAAVQGLRSLGRPVRQTGARVKLSPFYVAGELCDVRYVASNRKYAVNDEAYVAGVVRRDDLDG